MKNAVYAIPQALHTLQLYPNFGPLLPHQQTWKQALVLHGNVPQTWPKDYIAQSIP